MVNNISGTNSSTPAMKSSTSKEIKKKLRRSKYKQILKNYDLYLFMLPGVICLLIFAYGPMLGLVLAFKDYNPRMGIFTSPWSDPIFTHFTRFFKSYQFTKLLGNTLFLSIYQLVASFPIPIFLALMLHQVQNKHFKKLVQNITYAPYFISTVVMVGMLQIILSPRTGIVNIVLSMFGQEPILFMGKAEMFRNIYVWSGVWQTTGWAAIIYIATLAGISPELHEAAMIDGANRLKRVIHIDIPGILPTAITLLILNMGQVMQVGFEKAYLMQNAQNIKYSEIISTYVYTIGILNNQYSFATAVGIFNSVINLLLLITANAIAKRVSETSLW